MTLNQVLDFGGCRAGDDLLIDLEPSVCVTSQTGLKHLEADPTAYLSQQFDLITLE